MKNYFGQFKFFFQIDYESYLKIINKNINNYF